MRRSYATVLIVLLLAGCGGGGPEPLPTASARAAFRPGDVRDVITVSAVDRLALRSAELVAPNGAATPSDDINVERTPGFTGGQFALNDAWRTGLAGNVAAPVIPQDAQADAALRSQGQLLMIISNASLALPDPPAYRRDWRGYRLRLGFGEPGGEIKIRGCRPPPRRRRSKASL